MQNSPNFDPLLEVSPLGMLRLKLAWPELSAIEKSFLIERILDEKGAHLRTYGLSQHVNEFLNLALSDPNPYVRYVAASHVRKPYIRKGNASAEDLASKALYEKVLVDKEPAVRAAHGQSKEAFGFSVFSRAEGIEGFWAKDHARRLVEINNERGNHGEKVAEAFLYATEKLLPADKITIAEMLDVLLQYLSVDSIKAVLEEKAEHDDFFMDGWGRFSSGKDLEALWGAIPKLPMELQYVLVQSLPNNAGMSKNLAASVAEQLDPEILAQLLWRNDVPLPELRSKVFLEGDQEWLRAAAMSSMYFQLPDASITQLLYRLDESVESGKIKYKKLLDLLRECGGATLAQHFFLMYLVEKAVPFQNLFGPWDDLAFARGQNGIRFKKLNHKDKAKELFELRLAMLATDVAPIGTDEKPNEWQLEQITKRDLVLQGNPWQTYLNFKSVINENNFKSIIGDLPITNSDDDNTEDSSETEMEPEVATNESGPDLNKVLIALDQQIVTMKQVLVRMHTRLGILFWLTVAIIGLVLYFKL